MKSKESIQRKSRAMDFSGERLIPNLPELKHLFQEHIVRYMFASKFVSSKSVLDVGCGTGYGTFLLSKKNAIKTIGIDNSKKAIEYCKKNYKNKNLIFKVEDCIKTTFPSQNFDVLTSFELIEHLEQPIKFLKEAKRILKKDGLLILSTPNKLTYPSGNPFHFNEFTEKKLVNLLKKIFKNVTILYESYPPTLAIYKNGKQKKISEFAINEQKTKVDGSSALYFIAICSNEKPVDDSGSLYLLDDKTLLLENYPKLQDWIKVLQNDLKGQTEKFVKLQKEFDERSKWALELDKTVQEKDSEIKDLQSSINTKDSEIDNIQRSLFVKSHELEENKQSVLFKTMTNFTKKLDKAFPQNTRRGELLRLSKVSIATIQNEGFRAFLKAFREKQHGKVKFQIKNSSITDKKIKQYLETTEINDSQFDSKIIYNEGAVKIDENLRKDIQIGSSKILKLKRNPKVSIIIPTFNQTNLLKRNLETIELKTTYTNYEIIIVTNNKDKNSEMRRYLEGIKHTVLVYDDEYSFSEVNNYASKKAQGEYLLFLNDDMEAVSPNWLEAMLKLALDERVGAVGGKLLFPNGLLQEAGCIVWGNGNAWNYGRNDNPDKTDYNFVREVDYCSGSCLLIRRKIFEKIGCFDSKYKPAYGEDNDICHTIRQKGYKVLYQPQSCFVHHEGKTQGKDVSTGVKAFQIENQKKFRKKWNSVLKKRNLESPKNVFLERNRTEGLNILYLDHYIPEYDKDAGSLTTYYVVSILSSLNHNVTFWPANLKRTEPYTTELQQKKIEVIYGSNNFQEFLKNRGKTFHVCFIARPHIAAKYYGLLKKYAPKCKIIYDTIDLHFIREHREAALSKDSSKIISANKTKENELFFIRNSDVSILKSLKEAKLLLNEDSNLSTAVIPPLQIPKKNIITFEKRKDLLFLGGFQHIPNLDSIEYLVNDIFPEVRKSLPDVKLYVIGSNAPQKIKNLCANTENVVFLGYLPNIDTYLENCKIMLAPLKFGAGVKGKITQSFAYGLPVITTSIGAEGISSANGEILLTEDDPIKFANKVVTAYKNEELWNMLSKNGLAFAKNHYSPELARDTLKQILAKCLQEELKAIKLQK